MNCIFCRIINNEIPSMKVYEDDYTLAFMDIAKDVDGHILVIPKKHVETIMDCDSFTLNKTMDAVKMIANHLIEKCGYEGLNLLNASGKSADQSVGHFHIHIIPRKAYDGLNTWPKLNGANFPIEEIFEKIKMI